VVGDGHKVEWRSQLALDASRQRYSLAAAVPIRTARIVAVAETVRVERVAGVHVQVAKVGVALWIRRRLAGRLLRVEER
jgi:hypothetical protein